MQRNDYQIRHRDPAAPGDYGPMLGGLLAWWWWWWGGGGGGVVAVGSE